MCTRVGVLDRGRLVLQERWTCCSCHRTGCRTRTPDTAAGDPCSGGVEQRRRRLLVRAADPAALNAFGRRGPGDRARTDRRDLEQVVLEAPAGSPGGAAVIAVELKMLRRPRTWLIIGMLVPVPTLVAVLLAVTDLGPRPGTGPPFLSAVLSRRTLFPLAALGGRAAAVPADRGGGPGGDAIAGEAQFGTLRYLLARPVGRTHLLLAKLVTVGRLRAAGRAGRRRRLLRRGAPAPGSGAGDGRWHRQPERLEPHPAAARRAHGARHRRTWSSRC